MSKNKKESKKKVKTSSKMAMALPAVGIVGNVVFSKKEAWAYYKIGSVPYDFLTNSGRAKLANDIMIALSGLSQRAGRNVDLHILVTNTPFNVDSWEDQMFEIYDQWNGKNNRLMTFEKFIRKQTRAIKRRSYKKKVVYLGVKLFTRGTISFDDVNMLDFGFAEAYELLKKGISSLLVMPDEEITTIERNRANKDEYEVHRAIYTSTLRGTRLSSEEILLIMKKILYPSMPSPYLEVNHDERVGLSDIILETGAIIEDHRRYLKIKQMVGKEEREGYRATLSFSKFPSDSMREPGGIDPFMYLPTIMGLPFTMNSRLTLMPIEKMKKDLQKKKLENEDELKNLSGSGQRASSTVIDTQHDIDKLDHELNTDNHPWVSGNYRMTIEAPTYELLATAIQEMKQEYAKNETIITWTSGDQLEMLLEEMPGGELKMGDFSQLTNLAMIGVSGFNYGGSVGDPINEQLVLRRR
ncbi:MAG TPA: hypothetical protein GXZ90_02080 [Clostridiales bacterium]|nr:hypothetical protein [Clostridiales bacterium]